MSKTINKEVEMPKKFILIILLLTITSLYSEDKYYTQVELDSMNDNLYVKLTDEERSLLLKSDIDDAILHPLSLISIDIKNIKEESADNKQKFPDFIQASINTLISRGYEPDYFLYYSNDTKNVDTLIFYQKDTKISYQRWAYRSTNVEMQNSVDVR